MGALDLDKLAHERVELGVGDFRVVVYVVEPLMPADFIAQAADFVAVPGQGSAPVLAGVQADESHEGEYLFYLLAGKLAAVGGEMHGLDAFIVPVPAVERIQPVPLPVDHSGEIYRSFADGATMIHKVEADDVFHNPTSKKHRLPERGRRFPQL
jgi:hypothetical protein